MRNPYTPFLKLVVALGLFILFSMGAMAVGLDSVTGGYPYTLSASGLPDGQNLSITISTNASSVGAPGAVYVFSIARNGNVWSFSPDGGWQQVTTMNPALNNGLPSAASFSKLKPYSYFNALPATIVVQPLVEAAVSDKIGKVIYAGYGPNSLSMYRQGTYSAVYTETPGTTSPGLTTCHDTKFALCASSTCTALSGQTITNNQGLSYPAASCICPIVRGDNIADLKAGNQVGSCVSPEPSVIYSTYSLTPSYPQKVNGTWTQNVPAAPPGVCSGQNPTAYYAQCWNWKCKLIAPQNGVELAQCTCPMQTAGFWIEGSSNNACSSIPVGAALTKDAYDPTNPITD